MYDVLVDQGVQLGIRQKLLGVLREIESLGADQKGELARWMQSSHGGFPSEELFKVWGLWEHLSVQTQIKWPIPSNGYHYWRAFSTLTVLKNQATSKLTVHETAIKVWAEMKPKLQVLLT